MDKILNIQKFQNRSALKKSEAKIYNFSTKNDRNLVNIYCKINNYH